MQRFGLDFGTTNSSLAWARGAGDVVLCDLDPPALNPRVLRSLLYFSLDARDFVVGQRAISEYLAEDMQGTLIQSIKTFLADNSFEQTWINDRFYKLEDLIAVIFRHVRAVIATMTDDDVALVIGRPAVFVDRPEREALAQERLRKAAQLAGFFDLQFQYEPIAAGLAYEATLTRPELALIADLGGGTSDFTVMRLGTGATGDRRDDILATRGVQIAGDTFSERIMARKLARYFGAGSIYRSMEGEPLPFPSQLLAQLGRWHQVTFLRSPKTRELLKHIRWTSDRPQAVAAFEALLDANYSFFVFQEIEQAKGRLSEAEEARIEFRRDEIVIDELITRAEFEAMIERDRSEIRRCMHAALETAWVVPGDIDAVFLTGGSAQIPAMRRLFAEEFGEEKLKAQDYLTSVAVGLGLSALRGEAARRGTTRGS
jgi:hypothetical chaperone protein